MLKKFVYLMSVSSLLAMINNRFFDSSALRITIYGLMFLYVVWVVQFTYKHAPQFYLNWKVILLIFLLTINLIASPYNPMYPRLLKYFGYIGSFVFGYVLCKKNVKLKCDKWTVGSLVAIPLFLVAFFDPTPHKTMFFPLSNTYSYLGLCCALFLYTVYNDRKNILLWSVGLVLAYIASASSLGIVTSFALAIIIINRKSIKLVLSSCVIGLICLFLIFNVNLPIFLRIRDVVDVASSLSWYDWTHLKDMDFYKTSLQFDMQSNRVDNTSFLWRLAHWQFVFDGFWDNWWYAIPFGLGDCYSNKVCGNYCHNEFIKFFVENGVIVFCVLVSWLLKMHKSLKNKDVYYFILAIVCYHLTENLIDTFVACVLFYFSIGYWIKHAELEKQLSKK